MAQNINTSSWSYSLSFSGGTVYYNISPDYGSAIFPGDTVTLSGEAYWPGHDLYELDYIYFVQTRHQVAATLVPFPGDSSSARFTISFQIPSETYDAIPGRIWKSGADNEFEDDAYFTLLEDGPDGDMAFTRALNRSLCAVKYRLSPKVLAMNFERCGNNGAWANDGQHFRCEKLRLSKSAQALLEDFTTAQIVCSGSDGSSQTVQLSSSQLSAAFTEDGYSESGYSSSNVFYGISFSLNVTYTLTLTLGDAYEQANFVDTVMRSFARLHLSGAENGGVAIGMFSSATDQQPKFEVADTHESHFYGPAHFDKPVYFEGNLGTGGLPVGFTTVKLENSSSSSKVVSATIPSIAGATHYVCTGVAGWKAGSRGGYGTPPSVTGNTLSAGIPGGSQVMYCVLGVLSTHEIGSLGSGGDEGGGDEGGGSGGGSGSGTPGSMWYSGTLLSATSGTTSSASLSGDYRVGDYYLNTAYGYFYRCTTAGTGSAAIWTYQGSLRGPAGPYFTPHVSSDGTLSWTNDGGLPNPAAVNIKGPKGDDGTGGSFSGTLPVAQGGTGATSLTAHGILVGNGTNAVQAVGGSSTGAVYKTSSTSNPTIGTLPIAQGGTGATTASSALSKLGAAPSSHTHSNYLTSVPAASSSTRGGMYLYTATGQNTNGTMTQKAITDALASAGGSGGSGPIVYTSGEAATGSSWIDGKPIYRYCAEVSVSLTAGNSKKICTLPSAVDTIVYAFIADNMSSSTILGSHDSSNAGKQTRAYYVNKTTSELMAHIGDNAGGSRTFTIILEYTRA